MKRVRKIFPKTKTELPATENQQPSAADAAGPSRKPTLGLGIKVLYEPDDPATAVVE